MLIKEIEEKYPLTYDTIINLGYANLLFINEKLNEDLDVPFDVAAIEETIKIHHSMKLQMCVQPPQDFELQLTYGMFRSDKVVDFIIDGDHDLTQYILKTLPDLKLLHDMLEWAFNCERLTVRC
jgi:hypothetical protein